MSKLVTHGVSQTLFRMAVPMLAGTFAINMYNLTNAWFVSRLGTEALAAISFTFPIIMLLMLLTRGVSSGSLTLVAHAIGAKDHRRAARLTTHAILLAVCFAAVVSILGLLTITPVFSRLGATGEVLRLTTHYMRIWYLGAVIMAVQMVAGDVIISTGNTKAVSTLMVCSTGVNVILDMGLIFGRFGMPKMGIAGAALATILSQTTTLIVSGYILIKRMKLIENKIPTPGELVQSWIRILKFGVPGALGMILAPVSATVITRLAAGYGNAAVAALGVAGRIELFAFMIPMTVGMSLIPFVAQNYGAGRLDRIRTARKGTMTFAILYGVFIGLLFILFARTMAGFFSKEKEVVDVLCSYIYITCMGYGMLEVHRYAGFTMTGAHEPFKASILDILRMAVILIPLSILGSYFLGLRGIFWSRLVSDLSAGLIGIWWSGAVLSKKAGEANNRITESLTENPVQ